MSQRIAFVRMGPHPIPNRILPAELQKRFPEHRIEVFDVEHAIRGDWLSMLVNPIFVALEHGTALLRGAVRPWQAFYTTTWMFRRMSTLARRWIEAGDFCFSLQIQSLFDAASSTIQHFVYIDHTHLENLEYPDFDRRDLRRPKWLALERALYHGAAFVFTRSSNISRSLIETYGCDPKRVARVGVGSNASTESAGQRRNEGSHLLFVGADWDRKGGPDLMKAFDRLAECHPEARLEIVGCSPDVTRPGVEVRGYVPLEEIHRHYDAATIFCMPTRREPFGVAFVEALHHGLPVVATRVGALPDIVVDGENGFLVEVGDIEAMADALIRLADDPDLRSEMGDASEQHAREHYSWEKVTTRMSSIMKDACGVRSMR